MMPEWDFFKWYRLCGGFERVSLYVHVARDVATNEIVYIKSGHPVDSGLSVWYDLWNEGYEFAREDSPNAKRAVVIQSFSRDDFERFNFETATPYETAALGHFMCGACLHGQWFGDLFEQIRVLAHAVQGLQNQPRRSSEGDRFVGRTLESMGREFLGGNR